MISLCNNSVERESNLFGSACRRSATAVPVPEKEEGLFHVLSSPMSFDAGHLHVHPSISTSNMPSINNFLSHIGLHSLFHVRLLSMRIYYQHGRDKT